jgi:hypothetical protein
MSWTAVRQRGLALGLGTGLTVSGLLGAAVVLGFVASAGHAPDRFAMDGDLCCAVPDNWGQVASWSVEGTLVAAVDAAVLVGGLACLHFAFRYRPPSRWVALLSPVAAVAYLGVVALAQLAQAFV